MERTYVAVAYSIDKDGCMSLTHGTYMEKDLIGCHVAFVDSNGDATVGIIGCVDNGICESSSSDGSIRCSGAQVAIRSPYGLTIADMDRCTIILSTLAP